MTNLRSLPRRKINNLGIQRLVLPLVIIGIALTWAWVPTVSILKERSQNQSLKNKLQQKNAQNKELATEIKKLKTSPYIEFKARKDIGLVKPNEIQYYVLMKKAKVKHKKKIIKKSWWQSALNVMEDTFTR